MNRVISIGYGRQVFEAGNPERDRLMACAEAVAAYDMVIFSKKSHNLETQSPAAKFTVHPTNSSNNLRALIDAFYIARALIRSSSVPVTLTTQDPFETALIGILLKKLYGVKLIIQEHGDFFGTHHWRRESSLNRLRYYFGLWALKQADVVRVVSKRTKQRFEERGIKTVVTFPVEVDTKPLLVSTRDSDIASMVEGGEFVFLSVARFVPQKNFPLLLRSFAQVHQHEKKVRLVLVGKGSEESRMHTIISQFPKDTQAAISILPWSNDVGSLMRAASAYVLSSNYEGWGRVLIESMVAKLPIVTTKVGCAEEVVAHGEHGLVVSVDDEPELTKAMMRIATDDSLLVHIKQNLHMLDTKTLPGTDNGTYALHWAQIFG